MAKSKKQERDNDNGNIIVVGEFFSAPFLLWQFSQHSIETPGMQLRAQPDNHQPAQQKHHQHSQYPNPRFPFHRCILHELFIFN